jgi:hypothetical protein
VTLSRLTMRVSSLRGTQCRSDPVYQQPAQYACRAIARASYRAL